MLWCWNSVEIIICLIKSLRIEREKVNRDGTVRNRTELNSNLFIILFLVPSFRDGQKIPELLVLRIIWTGKWLWDVLREDISDQKICINSDEIIVEYDSK